MILNKLLRQVGSKNVLRQISSQSKVSREYQQLNRLYSYQPKYSFSSAGGSDSDKKISFFYVNKDGKEVEVRAKEGENLLEIAHQNNIDLEGACEMSLACSTCHVILEDSIYDSIEKATMEEEDLLDLAYGLTDTSRLGCQVKVSQLFQGAKITLPKATRNFYVDGHKPKPH